MQTAIVTDSTADIPVSLAKKHNIQVVPAILMLGEQSFEDGEGLTRREFYDLLPEMEPLPKTGTPSAGIFENVYNDLFDQGFQQIISIHVASTLSGIYSTSRLAAKNFEGRVFTIDSQSLSMGIGYQVLAAAEAAAANAKPQDIIKVIETTRQKIRVYAMLDTLEYVHRSGRVGWARARIGSLLRIKPFLEVKSGEVLSMGQARTRKKGIAYLKTLLSDLGNLSDLAILHTNAKDDALSFLKDIPWDIPADPLIVNVTTIIGTHVGPNALGFAAVLK